MGRELQPCYEMRTRKSRRVAMLKENGKQQLVGAECLGSTDNVPNGDGFELERVVDCRCDIYSRLGFSTTEHGVDSSYDCEHNRLTVDEVVENDECTKFNLLNIRTKCHVHVQSTICEYCGVKKFHIVRSFVVKMAK